MVQTLLIVVAILVFSLFALNQHRAQASAEVRAVGSEVGLAATDLAREHLLEATALPFDEALLGRADLRVDPAVLTPADRFGAGRDPGEDAATPADDVDDLHGTTVSVTVLRDGQAGRGLDFTVTYGVRYVLADAPGTRSPGDAPTLAKEVVVSVVEDDARALGRAPATCTLTQVVTPAWHVLHG
jgi:hypothetical protein